MTLTLTEAVAELTQSHHDVLTALRERNLDATAVADEVTAMRRRRNRGRAMQPGRARRLLSELACRALVEALDDGRWELTPAGVYARSRR